MFLVFPGLTVDAVSKSIEFEYVGRDSNRFVIVFLLRLADLVQDARGEIQCYISGDADDHAFEFYRIQDGKLMRQIADVVRRPAEIVSSD